MFAGSAQAADAPCAATVGSSIKNPPAAGTQGTQSGNVVSDQGKTVLGAQVASPGSPCWTEINPYPFGTDGGPVDPTSRDCKPFQGYGAGWNGDVAACYLRVDSMAFRAWNRGLAATSPVALFPSLSSTTAFGVWLFNGQRWYPDPSFPGQSVCKGDTVLWAGKRDYWLVGARLKNWPRLCRFDGVNFEWQPLDIPPAAIAHIPLDRTGNLSPGAINTGSCFSWDNCWFFGSYGIRLHWDGNQLSDATPDTAGSPWLAGEYTDTAQSPDGNGGTAGFATGTSGGALRGQQLPSQPDGSPPPQLFRSTGDVFGGLPFTPPTLGQSGDPYRTDLVSIDFDPAGVGWLAGVPVGYRAEQRNTPQSNPAASERRSAATQPSPLTLLQPDGTAADCSSEPSDAFTYTNSAGTDGYLWGALSVLPANDQLVAAGQYRPAAAGSNVNDDATREPVVVGVRCGAGAYRVRFRVKDPFVADQGSADYIPAARLGTMSAVAANATNDVWAATTQGILQNPSDPNTPVLERPHLYRLTDTGTPDAPAGDDDETRPLYFEPDPPIIVEAPPDPGPPPAPDTTVRQTTKKVKRVKQKPAIYEVKANLENRGRAGLYLVIRFRVRRPVTVGLEALRKKKVVSRTGLKHFRPRRGQLVVSLSRANWPTGVRFYGPPEKKKK